MTTTKRQLTYWIRQGYLTPRRDGRRFAWSRAEAAVRDLMGRLVDAGVTPATAASIARAHITLGATEHQLAPGITLTITPETPTP